MVWATCKGFSNYEVSNEGKVRNRKSEVVQKHVFSRKGIHQVILRDDSGRQQRVYVHDLMADAYFGGDSEHRDVIYRDGDYDNLSIRNIAPVKRKTGIQVRETGRIFKNRSDCMRVMGIPPSKLTLCLSKSTRSYNGYHYDEIDLQGEENRTINWDELEDYEEDWDEYYDDEEEEFDEN